MNGTTPIAGVAFPNPGPSWHVIGTGDFNGDGKADILWQNTDGTPAIWEMNGTTPIAGVVLPNPGSSSWHVIGTSDFNGDGKADILWQNTDGTVAIWDMNGTTPISGTVLTNPGAQWAVKDDGPIVPAGTTNVAASSISQTVQIGQGSASSNAAGHLGAPDPALGSGSELASTQQLPTLLGART